MLRETRRYIYENFEKDETISGRTYYQKCFTGYWKILLYVTDNCVDILMDNFFEPLILSKDKTLAFEVLKLFNRYYKKYSKLLATHKIKPKRMNEKEIAIFVDKVRAMDSAFNADIKKLKIEHKIKQAESDFI